VGAERWEGSAVVMARCLEECTATTAWSLEENEETTALGLEACEETTSRSLAERTSRSQENAEPSLEAREEKIPF